MPMAQQDLLPEVGFRVARATRHPPGCSQDQPNFPVQFRDRPNQASCAWVLAKWAQVLLPGGEISFLAHGGDVLPHDAHFFLDLLT